MQALFFYQTYLSSKTYNQANTHHPKQLEWFADFGPCEDWVAAPAAANEWTNHSAANRAKHNSLK